MSEQLIVLITGANQGIGYHAAQQLATTGKFKVLLGSRNAERGQKAVDAIVADKRLPVDKANIEPIQIDIDYDGSIKAAVETVESKYGHLDILVNNAGILGLELPSQGASVREQYHEIFNTNVFGQAVCLEMFEPLLRKSTAKGGKRIVFTSSVLGSLTLTGDPKYELSAKAVPVPIYRSSKTAENMLGVHYAAVLGEEGFCVCVVCPGYCLTNLNGYTGYKSPADGAKSILSAIEGEVEEIHSKFLHTEVENGRYAW